MKIAPAGLVCRSFGSLLAFAILALTRAPLEAQTWTGVDVGAVAAAGSDSGSGANHTVSGSGADIWGNSDEFRFRSTQWSGDGTFVARVTSMTNTHTWAKAGIMLRESLEPGARHVLVGANPGNAAGFFVRPAANGPTDFTLGIYEISQMWIRLVRSGNTFTAAQSADGVNWVQVGQPATLALPAALHAGLAVTSHQDGVLCTATFANVSFTGPGTPGGPGVPPPSGIFTSSDVGAVGAAGSASVSGGVITVRGAGEDIFGPLDEFHYYHRRWSGDGMFIVQVLSMDNTFNWAKAGIMLRSELTANAVHVTGFVTPERNTALIHRPTAGGSTTGAAAEADAVKGMPMWLKLTRQGANFSLHYSLNGYTWRLRSTLTLAMPETVYAGLIVSSHIDAALNTSRFDNLSFGPVVATQLEAVAHAPARVDLEWVDNALTETGYEVERSLTGSNFTRIGTAGVDAKSFADTSVSPSTTYYYRVRSMSASGPSEYSSVRSATTPPPAPAGWIARDIGDTSLGGRSSESGGVFTISGSGSGVGSITYVRPSAGRGDFGAYVVGFSDEFQFCSKPWSGDGEMVVRVNSLAGSSKGHAGIMIRVPDESGYNVFCYVAPGGGLGVMARPGTSTNWETSYRRETFSYHTATGVTVPRWLKLVRAEGGVLSFASADGVNWEHLAWVKTPLAANVEFGLAVSSGEDGAPPALPALLTATFENIAIRAASPLPSPEAPTNLRLHSVFETYIAVEWTNPSVLYDGIEVQRSTDGVNFVTRTITNSTIHTESNLQANTDYSFRIRSVRGTASSAWSPVLRVRTSTFPPPPSNLTAVAVSQSQIDLAWIDSSPNENGFFVEQSTDNATFQWIASPVENATSHSVTGLAPATTYYFRVIAYPIDTSQPRVYSNTVSATTQGSTPPPTGGWVSGDIGAVATAGSASESGGTVTLRGSGADIWNTADEFYYHRQSWNGDGELVVRVTGLTNTHGWAKAGVMLRESLAANARHVMMIVSIAHGTALQYRTVAGGESDSTVPAGTGGVPRWLRLVRTGNSFTGYASADGVNWSQAGAITIPLPTSLYAGLVVTSHNDGVLATATFDNVSVGGAAPPPPAVTPPNPPGNLVATTSSASQINLTWTDASANESGCEVERSTDNASYTRITTTGPNATSYGDTGLNAATLYFYRVRAVNSAGASSYATPASATTASAPPPPSGGTWVSQDIGAVAAAGSASESGGTVTLVGSGADIWDAGDEFHFRHQMLTGDGELIARVTGLTNTNGWAKAGVMFRESLAANARHAMMIVSVANGTALQYRTTPGGASATSTPAAGGVPRWVRLVRSGNTFTGYASADGVNWTQAGTVTLAFPSAVYAGLVVTSHNDGVLATATFTNVSAGGGAVPPPPPPPPPPSDTTWSFGDIGAVGLAGANTSTGNTITIRGAGADIWGQVDAFRFVYRSLSGDGVVEARVTSVQNTNVWAKAGVMIRESLEPGARNAFAFLTPSYHGVVAQARVATGGETMSSAGPLRSVPYWVRLTRMGTTFEAASSPDGVTWSTFARSTIPMGTTAYFGFAVTSHEAAQLNTAVFEDPFVQ